jgi:transcriptional regulator with XRE-family HTH domain
MSSPDKKIAEEKVSKFMKGLGQSLRRHRISRGLTQEQLGRRTGRNQSAIGKMERGPAPGLPLQVLLEVADALPIAASQLIQEAESYAEIKKNAPEANLESLASKLDRIPAARRDAVMQILDEVLLLIPQGKSGRSSN